MININRVLKNDRVMRSLTGLNRKAFNELLVPFAAALEEAKYAKPRHRAPGAGSKPRLRRDEDKLFYILFYFKCYPTFDVAGVLFDFDRSQANRWVHSLQAILEVALGKEMALLGHLA